MADGIAGVGKGGVGHRPASACVVAPPSREVAVAVPAGGLVAIVVAVGVVPGAGDEVVSGSGTVCVEASAGGAESSGDRSVAMGLSFWQQPEGTQDDTIQQQSSRERRPKPMRSSLPRGAGPSCERFVVAPGQGGNGLRGATVLAPRPASR